MVQSSEREVKALERKGKKAKLLFSWDEYDRIRKIPVNVQKADKGMEKYIKNS